MKNGSKRRSLSDHGQQDRSDRWRKLGNSTGEIAVIQFRSCRLVGPQAGNDRTHHQVRPQSRLHQRRTIRCGTPGDGQRHPCGGGECGYPCDRSAERLPESDDRNARSLGTEREDDLQRGERHRAGNEPDRGRIPVPTLEHRTEGFRCDLRPMPCRGSGDGTPELPHDRQPGRGKSEAHGRCAKRPLHEDHAER